MVKILIIYFLGVIVSLLLCGFAYRKNTEIEIRENIISIYLCSMLSWISVVVVSILFIWMAVYNKLKINKND